MKRKKRLFSIFLSLCLCISMIPLSVFADEPGSEGTPMTLADLNTQLTTAATAENKTVSLTGNVTITDSNLASISKNGAVINIPAGVTLEGNGHSIIAEDRSATNKNKCHILGVIGAAEGTTTTIKGLTIVGNANTKSGIHAYNCAGTVALEGVTIKSCGNAAVQVNGAKVTATGLTTEGNAWGAVNVVKGTATTVTPSFILNSGTLSEPAKIWTELTGEGTVVTVPDEWEAKKNGEL